MDYLDDLSAFASSLRYEQLPADLREQIAWILADTIAAIVSGSAEPELRAMAQRLAGGQDASLLGLGRKASQMEAALINGTAGTFLEMDEGNRFSRGHPAIHVLPAVLALSESQNTDAHQFLAAFAAGYEVGSRFGAASSLHAGVHPHGTWGTLGAAAGCAHIRGANQAAMRNCISTAASMSIASTKNAMLQGSLVRNVYAGLANSNGLLATQLVECGFGGEVDGPASLLNGIVSSRFEPHTVIAGLGTDWHLMQNYFKLHSCCRFNHGTLDALDMLAQRGSLPSAENISAVHVSTYKFAAELNDTAPSNTLGAKFSVPFAVATRIVTGSSGVSSFTWDAVRNPDIQALARKVSVQEDPGMTARLPHERPAHVRILTRDGIAHEAAVGVNRGDDASPYSRDELAQKFLDLCTRVWTRSHADALLNATLSLVNTSTESSTSMRQWLQLLRASPTR